MRFEVSKYVSIVNESDSDQYSSWTISRLVIVLRCHHQDKKLPKYSRAQKSLS